MSVSVVPKPADHQPQRPTYSQLATDAVFDNHSVCDECFARVRTNHGRRAFRGIKAFDATDKDAYGAIKSYRERTTCGDCGSIGCSTIAETLSVQEAVDRVPKLIARLEEAGHSPNADAMFYIVRQGKQRNGLHAHDDELFELAAKVGLRKGSVTIP